MEYQSWVKNLTLREQALLLTGADFWHTNGFTKFAIPSIMVSDGPNGLRKEEKTGKFTRGVIETVCYPSATALAASWDRGVMSQVGSTLADECKAKRVSVLLGPGINIKRSPLCGRNFEYYSEDPVLAGELAASYINALQAKGVGSSIKHFAANNTETRRMICDSLVDERALREIYLRGFEIAVKKAQPWTVMCAYNKLNGVYCTENKMLITDILRGEWGFTGLTVSDWASVNNRADALNAGLDLEMPGTGNAGVSAIAKAYRTGKVTAEKVEESATRVLELVTKSEPLLKQPVTHQVDKDAHHAIATQLAEQCAVLLKNDGGLLPLDKTQTIAVIGERAKTPIYQGCGSAQINSYRVDNTYDALKAQGVAVQFAPGYNLFYQDEANEILINDACSVASRCNVALVFVSCSEVDVAEGADRKDIKLPAAQVQLIEAVCKVNPNVAVIVSTGSNIEMPWAYAPRAIMQTYLLGEASGTAIANLLLGNAVPSGKLPETYPISLADTPCPQDYQPNAEDNVIYRESIYVGYRYYEKANVPVLFPFGHGLSYTNFNYSNISLSSNNISADDTLTVNFAISNVGQFNAAEVAQVYVARSSESLVYRAPKELKEFTKVFLPVGGSQNVSVQLDRRAFEYYSTALGAWVVEPGSYDIMIGSSSADIRLRATVQVSSNDDLSKELDYMYSAPKYYNGDIKSVTDEDFEQIFGDYLDYYKPAKSDDRILKTDSLADAADTYYGKMIIGFVNMVMDTALGKDSALKLVAYNSIVNAPMIRFVANTRGVCSETMVDALVHLLNSSSVTESARIAVKGLPSAAMNVLVPVIRAVIEKKSRV